ncbi:hypothetical protein FRC11_012791, partial [Ceratobasidium sp. 423]
AKKPKGKKPQEKSQVATEGDADMQTATGPGEDSTKPPAGNKGKGKATTKPARPIRLGKDAFRAQLDMAKKGLVAEDLAKKKGNKMFNDTKRAAEAEQTVEEA